MTKANQMIYCVMDSNGRFGGKLGIYSNSMTKRNADWKWDYYSTEIPMVVDLGKQGAELKLQKLQELNSFAKYDLDWSIVELTEDQWMKSIEDCHQKYVAMGIDHMSVQHYTSSIVMKEIEKGCIGKHRKAVREIYKRYKSGTIIKKQVA